MTDRQLNFYLLISAMLCCVGSFFGFHIAKKLLFGFTTELVTRILMIASGALIEILSIGLALSALVLIYGLIIVNRK